MPESAAAPPSLAQRPVICVSHGFQVNYERGFTNALAACGVDVTLVACDRTDRAGLSPAVHAVDLRSSTDPQRSKAAKAFNLLRYHASLMAYALLHRNSIVHVMGTMWPLWLCGIIEGLWFRVVCHRYVLTVHDLLPHSGVTPMQRRAWMLAYRLPQRLVVHTPRMKEELQQLCGAAADRITVMEHGLEPWRAPLPGATGATGANGAAVAADAADAVDAIAGAAGLPQLLVFGAQAPRKGTELLLHALADADFPWRLTIAGACPDAQYRALLRRTIDSHPQRERIEWRDRYIEESEAEALLSGADVIVLPYRFIDQSGVLFQALRFGVPVVATRVGQFERYVTPELGELADAIDAPALRQALARWSRRRASFSRQRIQEIGQAYEWPTTVQVLKEVYRS